MDPFESADGDSRLEFDDPEHRGHSSEGSGTGRLLTMFFGAAVVCAIFFGLGYKMGKSASTEVAPVIIEEPKPVAASAPKPSAMSNRAPQAVDASAEASSPAASTSGMTASGSPAPPAKL